MAYSFPQKIFPSALNYYIRCPFKFKCHNDKEIKDLEKKVIEFLKQAKNDISLLPRINKLCSYCEYLNVCPKKDNIFTNEKKIDEVNW